jgi:hypothetical protein
MDATAVETGTFNFTNARENSDTENAPNIDSAPELAERDEGASRVTSPVAWCSGGQGDQLGNPHRTHAAQ